MSQISVPLCCHVSYQRSLRHRATAVRSAAAVHHPVARLEETQAQRPPQVSSPKDTQHRWLRGSCYTHWMQQHTLWLALTLFSHVYRLSEDCWSSLLYTTVEYDPYEASPSFSLTFNLVCVYACGDACRLRVQSCCFIFVYVLQGLIDTAGL